MREWSPLGDDPPGRFLTQLRQLYRDHDEPTAAVMAKNAANRRHPEALKALLGDSTLEATKAWKLNELVSSARLPTPVQLLDLLLGIPKTAPPPGDELRRWLDERQAAADWLAEQRAAERRGTANNGESGLVEEDEDALPLPPTLSPRDEKRRFGQLSRRWRVAIPIGAALVVAAVLIPLLLTGSSSSHHHQVQIIEIVGDSQGSVRTWSDPYTAGGTNGPTLPEGDRQPVICRLTGFTDPDHNQWWYKLGGDYHGRYYATADGFYNTPTQDTGTLHNTPFVDNAVPVC